MLKYVSHYLWIFKLLSIPKLKIIHNDKKDVTGEDIHLCERLLKAHKSLKLANAEMAISPLWADTLKSKHGKLTSALESGNSKILSLALSTMFKEDFVYGLASGDLVKNSTSTLGSKIWSLKYFDNIIGLAEYLGVVRKESPQQGRTAQSLDNLDSLIKNVENHLKASINFPDVGSPYGVRANNSLVTMESPEHIYVALRVYHAIKRYQGTANLDKLKLVEIGGGYGGLAFWIHSLGKIPVQSYTIIDLPIINILQGYFLSKAIDPSSVCFFGETPTTKTQFHILPTTSFESINYEIDILINENSMPEMTGQIVEDYIRAAKNKGTKMFFSYNHEAYAPAFGADQVLVPEIVSRVGGFKRIDRNISWVRNGYAEETYIGGT